MNDNDDDYINCHHISSILNKKLKKPIYLKLEINLK